jgi:hypothetical protein
VTATMTNNTPAVNPSFLSSRPLIRIAGNKGTPNVGTRACLAAYRETWHAMALHCRRRIANNFHEEMS